MHAGVVVGASRIGVPEPPRDFVPSEEEWAINCPALDLEAMRPLRYEPYRKQKDDVFFTAPMNDKPLPKRVAWIDVTDACTK